MDNISLLLLVCSVFGDGENVLKGGAMHAATVNAKFKC